jgi:small subunit ribosomal protein S13
MPRILGVDVPAKKRLIIALTYIYGIGLTRSAQIIDALHLDKDQQAGDLKEDQVAQLNKYLIDPKSWHINPDSSLIDPKRVLFEGDLRRQVASDIKRLQGIGCYRGIRHRKGLPVRGQRTRTNARTRKGPRRTVANKKM